MILFGILYLLCCTFAVQPTEETLQFPSRASFGLDFLRRKESPLLEEGLPASGLVVVVFGGTGTKGSRIAEEFLFQGAQVVVVSRRKQRFLNLKNPKLAWLRCDIRLHSEIEAALSKIKATYGKIDVAINACMTEPSQEGNELSLNFPFITRRDRDNIVLKIPSVPSVLSVPKLQDSGAQTRMDTYLFMNLIGISNLNYIEQTNLIPVVVNAETQSSLRDALFKDFASGAQIQYETTFLKMKLDSPQEVLTKVLDALKLP